MSNARETESLKVWLEEKSNQKISDVSVECGYLDYDVERRLRPYHFEKDMALEFEEIRFSMLCTVYVKPDNSDSVDELAEIIGNDIADDLEIKFSELFIDEFDNDVDREFKRHQREWSGIEISDIITLEDHFIVEMTFRGLMSRELGIY